MTAPEYQSRVSPEVFRHAFQDENARMGEPTNFSIDVLSADPASLAGKKYHWPSAVQPQTFEAAIFIDMRGDTSSSEAVGESDGPLFYEILVLIVKDGEKDSIGDVQIQ